MSEAEVLLDGLCFAEAPRWRNGRLWFSDMQGCAVRTVDLTGHAETVVETPGPPSGLGWLPGGDLLIVSMLDRCILRFDGARLSMHADLSGYTSFELNDMIALDDGTVFVGNFGYDIRAGASVASTMLNRVAPDSSHSVAATDLLFPNGMALADAGRTLLVAETRGPRISAFDVASDGTLSHRRVWAELDATTMPDGIALDAEGALWVASPRDRYVFRVREGGKPQDHIEVSGMALACAFGGDGHDLLICTSKDLDVDACRTDRPSCIERTRVPVAGAGWARC